MLLGRSSVSCARLSRRFQSLMVRFLPLLRSDRLHTTWGGGAMFPRFAEICDAVGGIGICAYRRVLLEVIRYPL